MTYKKEPIKEFPEYSVDTNGIVYGKTGNPMSPSVSGKGYLLVTFFINGKCIGRLVHRLVAEQFIPNPENKPTVNHINGDKKKNSVDNLEWATYQEQINHCNSVLYKKNYDFSEDWEKFEDIIFVISTSKLIIFPSQRTATAWFWKEYQLSDYHHASQLVWYSLNRIRHNKRGDTKRCVKGCTFWRIDDFNYYLATGKLQKCRELDVIENNNYIPYQCENLKINPNYTIDTLGVVTNKNTCREIQTYPDKDGCPIISLRDNGVATSYRIARLVAEQFIPNPNKYPVVWYKDNDPRNYNANNLIWVSYKQLCALQNNKNAA